MRHDRLLYVLVPLYLMIVGALVIKQIWLRDEAKPVATKDQAAVIKEDMVPVAKEDKAPVVDKADDAGPQADESGGKRA
ncbi:MAG: hypothetical protein WA801_20215 [Pseudolabrys sp.]